MANTLCLKKMYRWLAIIPVFAYGLEFGVDGSFTSSSQVDNWGASGHVQAIGEQGYGIDLGYQYLNSITYNALNTSLTHSLSQYEASALWQTGDRAFRLQALAGAVFANNWIQSSGQDVITQYSPGYQVGIGVSVPVFTRVRAFAEAGYQGWLNAEIPAHTKWRYGVRIILGGSKSQKLEAQEKADEKKAAVQAKELAENPPVTIDPNVPRYVPGHLSQSLPPIVANAELCKCYPAGPYTLQLGEFTNMSQAIRSLEYRGLRQFFNSRAYLNAPLPVFLAQAEETGPVGVYLGELVSIEQLQYWRKELRKNGLQARFRKIVGTDGSRIANPVVEIDEESLSPIPKYTAEEIKRMNSLPEEELVMQKTPMSDFSELVSEQAAFEEEKTAMQQQLNTLDNPPTMIDAVLQIGPIPSAQITDMLSTPAMRKVLSQDAMVKRPLVMNLTWDQSNQEAWLSFDKFADEQHVDEWTAWFEGEGLVATRVQTAFVPLGDVYQFDLGQPLEMYSVEIDRQTTMASMLQSMRSPEVLWFQAFQRINGQPVKTTLNWSETDNRYHLIITNVESAQEQQKIWADLTSVGLLPSLAEE